MIVASAPGDPELDLPISRSAAVSDAITCALRPRRESVRAARDFTRTTLQNWGMADLFADMSVVVSELVTNALRYGLLVGSAAASRPAARIADQDLRWPIQLSLLCNGTRVMCAVKDPSNEVPVLKEPDCLADSGRGLHLVEALSRQWGWTLLTKGGKAVWALFDFSS